MVNSNDNSNGADGKTICTKLLMETIKRDISAVEASYLFQVYLFTDVAISFNLLVYLAVEFWTGLVHK